jgi:hypothetical protein
MAVAMLQMAEMFTKEIYDQVSEKMFGHREMRPEEAPEGLILHSAGQGDRGWVRLRHLGVAGGVRALQ